MSLIILYNSLIKSIISITNITIQIIIFITLKLSLFEKYSSIVKIKNQLKTASNIHIIFSFMYFFSVINFIKSKTKNVKIVFHTAGISIISIIIPKKNDIDNEITKQIMNEIIK
jgi:hypothetical protein